MNEQSLTIRETAKGIAVRAGILGVAGVVAGGIVMSLAMRAASVLVRVLIGLFLLLVTGGVVTWEARKFRRHLAGAV